MSALEAACAAAADEDALLAFVSDHRRLFVLTGAGISTDSGIPDYRGPDGQWKGRAPMLLQEFVATPAARQRYWSRSMAGWPRVARAQPNAAHRALASLERAGFVHALVTQNVDGLHARAGSTSAIELHGNLHRVVCLACGHVERRSTVQAWLEAANPSFAQEPTALAPDGDALVAGEDLARFHVPECALCGGVLKPDVVFFGESVPRPRVDAAAAALAGADAVLVVGSSLMVYSGYRFCEWAARSGKPMAALTLGHTRADALLAVKAALPCGPALERLASAVVRRSDGASLAVSAPMPASVTLPS